MAGYAYKENAQAIEETLRFLEPTIGMEKNDLAQTRKTVADLRVRVSMSSNRDSPLPQDLKKYCSGFDYTWVAD